MKIRWIPEQRVLWIQSPWQRSASHHRGGDRRDVPAGAGGGFGLIQDGGPDGSISGDGGGGTQPGAHAGVGEGAGAAPCVLLTMNRSEGLQAASFQEVGEHLTFALHADLSTANKVVTVRDESVNIIGHLTKR